MTQNHEHPAQNIVSEIILGVIRRELPLSALSQIGIDIKVEAGSYKLESTTFDVAVRPTTFDLALGILNFTRCQKDELSKWAFFILGECGAIDLDRIESDPHGEVLIEALWDFSFRGEIRSEIVALAERIKLDHTRH